MLKKAFILMTMLVLAVLPALAQNTWYAFVFNGLSGQLVRVDAAGGQMTFDLAMPENAFVSGSMIALSPDGSRVAYCPNTPGSESAQGTSTLIVRDLEANNNVLEVDLGASVGCQVSDDSLNEDGSQVAVSLVRYFPGDVSADTSSPVWHLYVYDINSGQVVHELSADSPASTEAGVVADAALLPEVRSFANNQIIFAEVPWAIGGAPEWRAFIWDLSGGTLQLDNSGFWGKSGLSTLPNGEIVWVDTDPNRPSSDPGGPIPAFNVIRMADSGGEARTIYHNGERILIDTAFINGGAQLGVVLLTPFDIDNPALQATEWAALGRDGSLTPLGEGAAYVRLVDAPGGYAAFQLQVDEANSQQSVVLDYVANGSTTRLWEASDMGWEMVGATPVSAGEDFAPFPAVE